MSVAAYEAKFHELARFAPELVATDEDQMFLFLQGINPDLQITIRGLRCVSLADMVERAAGVERGLFLSRGLNPKRPRDSFSSPSQRKKGGWKKRGSSSQQSQSNFQMRSSQSQTPTCFRCGARHSLGVRCDGAPIVCFSCGKPGHRASACRSGGAQSLTGQRGSQGQFRQPTQVQGQGRPAASVTTVQRPPQQTVQQMIRRGRAPASSSGQQSGRVYTLT
ncbi:hypothetical protein Dimus_039563 [Dionaea muscipula]